MKVGIDAINFFTPGLVLSMKDLANARGVDPNKYLIGIMQEFQSVVPNSQDAVTMAANAAAPLVNDGNRDTIDLVIFGTESGIDNSKAAAIYLQNLLGLSPRTRAFEIKQACYGATAGLQMARDYVALHPDKRALVVGSDVARYGLNTPGEVTQGGGAVAMLVAADPRVLTLDGVSTFYSKDVMDFWRPLARTEAVVDGHYSNDVYVDFFQDTWQQYQKLTGITVADLAAFAFHLPYPKMGLKALRTVLPEATADHQDELQAAFVASSTYGRAVGNLYTGSLYLSLLSLLDNATDLAIGQRIGLFSYGSGAQGEFFTGELATGFADASRKQRIQQLLAKRTALTVDQYERVFSAWPQIMAGDYQTDWQSDPAQFVFTGVKDQQRQYLNRQA